MLEKEPASEAALRAAAHLSNQQLARAWRKLTEGMESWRRCKVLLHLLNPPVAPAPPAAR